MNVPARLLKWQRLVTAMATEYALDPCLVMAVLERESRGGEALTPANPSGTGDKGHGRGLWQLDDRAHTFTSATDDTGRELWKDPVFNCAYACRLLARHMLTFRGDVAAVVGAYNAGAGSMRKALAMLPPDAPLPVRIAACDRYTANHDYVAHVLQLRALFSGAPDAR